MQEVAGRGGGRGSGGAAKGSAATGGGKATLVWVGAGVAGGGLEAGTPRFASDFPVITGKGASFITYLP